MLSLVIMEWNIIRIMLEPKLGHNTKLIIYVGENP